MRWTIYDILYTAQRAKNRNRRLLSFHALLYCRLLCTLAAFIVVFRDAELIIKLSKDSWWSSLPCAHTLAPSLAGIISKSNAANKSFGNSFFERKNWNSNFSDSFALFLLDFHPSPSLCWIFIKLSLQHSFPSLSFRSYIPFFFSFSCRKCA